MVSPQTDSIGKEASTQQQQQFQHMMATWLNEMQQQLVTQLGATTAVMQQNTAVATMANQHALTLHTIIDHGNNRNSNWRQQAWNNMQLMSFFPPPFKTPHPIQWINSTEVTMATKRTLSVSSTTKTIATPTTIKGVIFSIFRWPGVGHECKKGQERANMHIGLVLVKSVKQKGILGICWLGVRQGRCWSRVGHGIECWSSYGKASLWPTDNQQFSYGGHHELQTVKCKSLVE